MRKISIVLVWVLLLVGCQPEPVDTEAMLRKIDTMQITVSELTVEKIELMNQIKDISRGKLDLEALNKSLEKELIIVRSERETLIIDNEALLKNLDTIEFDTYVAQYNFDVKVLSRDNNWIRYVLEESPLPHAQHYTVIGFDTNTNTLIEADNGTLEFGDSEFEVTSIKVEGTIFNFKWATIEWDETSTSYDVIEVKESVDVVTNQRININSILPEGLPGEVVQWENSQGKIFKMPLSYDGYGIEGTIIISN